MLCRHFLFLSLSCVFPLKHAHLANKQFLGALAKFIKELLAPSCLVSPFVRSKGRQHGTVRLPQVGVAMKSYIRVFSAIQVLLPQSCNKEVNSASNLN